MADFTVRAEDPQRTEVTVDADDIHEAVEGAWRMQRFYETPVLIIDNRVLLPGEQPRAIARVNVEWLEAG